MATLTSTFEFTDADPSSRKLITSVDIINPVVNGGRENGISALWDTGATYSAISPRIVRDLSLTPCGKVTNMSFGGPSEKNLYITSFSLANNFPVDKLIYAIELDNIPYGCEAMIGMDIIGIGDFSVCGKDGRICMSFRYPSLHTIDYVQDAGLVILPRP